MNFVRNQVRLNCDLNTAYKSLTNLAKIADWESESPKEILSDNKNYVQWMVQIPFELEDQSTALNQAYFKLEFYLMSCTESTEYCTEIHMITKLNEEDSHHLNQYSKALLEKLRFYFNKSWVIQDKDLTLSSLKRSR